MNDFLNLHKVNKNILDFIFILSSISSVCEDYLITPDKENGEKLIEMFEKAEENMLKVKKEVAIMVEVLEDSENDNLKKEN